MPDFLIPPKPAARLRPGRTRRQRRGAILAWFALLLVLLLGMTGLVIDAGLLMAGHRQAQNAADAAALAAAHDLLWGRPFATAQATAIAYVQQHNGLADAPTPVVNNPPAAGPYAGQTHYVEVIVTAPVQSYLIHLLPGVEPEQDVRARAVAGFEYIAAGEGVAVLDPNARPGLSVSGGGILKVDGLVVVNSEGGGIDENGAPVNNGNNGVAASGANQPDPTTGIFARDIQIVGGVDKLDDFKNINPDDPTSVLHCNQLPVPDPLLFLATPTTANGVDGTRRGSAQATTNNLKLSDPSGLNRIDTTPGTGVKTMVLHPGVYDSISIDGGNVYFVPGIYVFTAQKQNDTTLKITGGNVTAEGIMVYNTGKNYDPVSGLPDSGDGAAAPPAPDTNYFGSVQINAGVKLSPIDTETYNYGNLYDGAKNIADDFNGMLFYQRRRNPEPLRVEGNAEMGELKGALYAKWAPVTIAGQGTYDAQFVVGSMVVTGLGDITINYTGRELAKAPRIFLVE